MSRFLPPLNFGDLTWESEEADTPRSPLAVTGRSIGEEKPKRLRIKMSTNKRYGVDRRNINNRTFTNNRSQEQSKLREETRGRRGETNGYKQPEVRNSLDQGKRHHHYGAIAEMDESFNQATREIAREDWGEQRGFGHSDRGNQQRRGNVSRDDGDVDNEDRYIDNNRGRYEENSDRFDDSRQRYELNKDGYDRTIDDDDNRGLRSGGRDINNYGDDTQHNYDDSPNGDGNDRAELGSAGDSIQDNSAPVTYRYDKLFMSQE